PASAAPPRPTAPVAPVAPPTPPAAVARPTGVMPTPVNNSSDRYVIRSGDSLSTAAKRFGATNAGVAAANRLSSHDVRPGMVLLHPRLLGDRELSGGLPRRVANDPERRRLAPVFKRWANEYGVPADLLMAIAFIESGWQNRVTSSAGAQGVGQLMPGTTNYVNNLLGGLDLDARKPEENIRLSARYLRFLLDFTGAEPAAVAAYNMGPGALTTRGIYNETEDYVRAVLSSRGLFRGV
ncbi:MAG: transglycosylase SLT domain-containing protein, partial [Acidimicrobiales bacterium]